MAFIPNDTRFADQWHLRNTSSTGLDLNLVDVWDDYTGSGVEVVAIDRGFDFFHQDFDNYRTDLDWDLENNDSVALPDPGENDRHGTPVLGLIGAAQDGDGTVGIAFGADIIGYKTDWGRAEIADGIERASDNGHDIVNMSYWNGTNMFSPTEQNVGLVDAIRDAAADGRGGLGLVMVKSAGNGRGTANATDRAEATIESVNNLRETVVVAGVRQNGEVNGSSSPGANVLVSGFYGGVLTTDEQGAAGYNATDFTNFNGTSAAAPQIAGVIALILEANPDLGWRDVQEILAYSARHVGSDVGSTAQGNEQATQTNGATWFWNDADDWNGGGLHFSNDYGFGLVDAEAAVRLAETWTGSRTSANEVNPARIDALDSALVIAEGSGTGGSNFFSMTFDQGIEVEHITLGINFVSVADLADLEVYLTSPGGTRVQLIADTGDTGAYSGYWRFGSTAFRGEDSAGTWRLEVRDDDSAVISPIEINDVDLWTHGAALSTADRFVFTNEYSDYAGVAGHSTNIDGGAGNDTLNTAAVDSGVIVNLQSGAGSIDGVAVSLSSIETVYTGVHQDIVFDGAGNNEIHTGRGNDIARDTTAGGSDDWFLGQGNDQMQVRTIIGSDAFRGGQGVDTISWTTVNETGATFDLAAGTATDANGNTEVMRGFENFVGTANRDTIIEGGAANEIDGYEGNDTVIVTTAIGADSFDGGVGSDMIDWSAVNETGATFDLAAGTATDANGNSEIMVNFEDFCGTENADIIIENTAINRIDAKGGNDLLFVTTNIGADSFNGGFGTDTIDWSGSSQTGGTYDISGGTATALGGASEVMFGFENFIGTNQNDIIIEGNGLNEINAGSGNDTLRVNTAIGGDSLNGGFGTDTIDWSGSSQTGGTYDISGGTASAGGETEVMFGFENFIGTNQNDIIIEGGGLNEIDAGSGNDTLRVNTAIGGDSLNGGFGTDTIDWSGSSQSGGTYDISGGTATAVGGASEVMFGFENFIGTGQRDTVIEGAGTNIINLGAGNDLLRVNTGIGEDAYEGGAGTDLADWSAVVETGARFNLEAGWARDTTGNQEAMTGFEDLYGTQFDDRIWGTDAGNLLRGLGGDDLVYGGAGADLISGGGGADNLRGNGGADLIDGGNGNDLLRGGGGADVLIDGTGRDRMLGGDGADIFRLHLDDDERDRIDDFELGSDRIELAGLSFAQLEIDDRGNGDVRIRFDGDQVLILRDQDDMLEAAAFTAADFIF